MARQFALLAVFFIVTAARADHYILVVAVDAQLKEGPDTIAASTKPVGPALAKASRKLSGTTHYRELLGEKATRANVLAALKSLERLTAKDTAIVYFHMHGGYNTKNDFWLGAAEYDGKRIPETAILGEDLRKTMSRLRGPSVLCVSSCHSGGLLIHPGTWGRCQVIVSCSAHEESKRKAMDTAVIEAIGGKADRNKDGVVSIQEFCNYVEARIIELHHEMHPTARDNISTGRQALGRVK